MVQSHQWFWLLMDHESGKGSSRLVLAYLEFLYSCWSKLCMLHPLHVGMGILGCQKAE